MKKQLDDTEALVQHYRQRSERQEEADVLKTAELDRAKRDLDMIEERRAETERRWFDISHEKLRVDLKLQKLELEVATVSRSRDEILKQLEATAKEARRTSDGSDQERHCGSVEQCATGS
jgi:chromosome segregation ATPase